MSNNGWNHGFFLSLFKLISSPIHWNCMCVSLFKFHLPIVLPLVLGCLHSIYSDHSCSSRTVWTTVRSTLSELQPIKICDLHSSEGIQAFVAQTHKSISFIWIVWSTLYVYLWLWLENKSVCKGVFVFVMITEIFWRTFWHNNLRSLISVVGKSCSCVKKRDLVNVVEKKLKLLMSFLNQ